MHTLPQFFPVMNSLALQRITELVASVGHYDPVPVGISLMKPLMACFYKAPLQGINIKHSIDIIT